MKIRWTLGLLIICVLLTINIGQLAAEKTWTQRADMPTARYNFGTCVVDGKVFAIGGEINEHIFTEFEKTLITMDKDTINLESIGTSKGKMVLMKR